MARRFNCITNRKEPKKSATFRTWSRYRVYHNITLIQDKERLDKLFEVKEKVYERLKNKVKKLVFRL